MNATHSVLSARQVALGLLAGVSLASVASGAIVMGNLPEPNNTSQTAGINNLRLKAIAFTMPVGPAYTLDAVELVLSNYDPTDTVFIEIRNHTGSTTAPGATVLASLTAAGLGGTNVHYNFTPTTALNLDGGTSYWLFVGGSAGQTFDWEVASPGVPYTGIASVAGNLFTTNGGTSWTTSTSLNNLEIRGTLVPAPGALTLVGGLAAFGARRRR